MNAEPSGSLDRYVRQIRFAPLGQTGQENLRRGRVLLCGCGALGSVLANTLVRAGVGFVRLVDRDFLELNNLQRQVLYDEHDVASGLPKAIAARNKLQQINSQVEIEAMVVDVHSQNVLQLASDVHVLIDGTDNFETRYLLNDVSIKQQLPWIYGGCLGATGQTMTILPGRTPCFRCLHREPPPPGATETCDSAGILGSIINVVASLQALEAIKILSGKPEAASPFLTVFELWENRIRQIKLGPSSPDCPACAHHQFEWLAGQRGSHTAVLCGRNSVQLSLPERHEISLESLASKLEAVGQVQRNEYLLRCQIGDYLLTLFPDGRAIIGGTEDVAEAKTVYAKYVGI